MTHYDALLVNAGTGNLHSVYNALQNLGFQIKITDQPEDLKSRSRVILPGVGAFGSFMQGMQQLKLVEAVQEVVARGDPMLGICVGMQALFEISRELGIHQGLNLLKGEVVQFPEFKDLKVPHTGWNQLIQKVESPLMKDIPADSYAYFNHSFYCNVNDPSNILTETDYGIKFASAVQHENLFGVQFHPEKSQLIGQKILANFFEI